MNTLTLKPTRKNYPAVDGWIRAHLELTRPHSELTDEDICGAATLGMQGRYEFSPVVRLARDRAVVFLREINRVPQA